MVSTLIGRSGFWWPIATHIVVSYNTKIGKEFFLSMRVVQRVERVCIYIELVPLGLNG